MFLSVNKTKKTYKEKNKCFESQKIKHYLIIYDDHCDHAEVVLKATTTYRSLFGDTVEKKDKVTHTYKLDVVTIPLRISLRCLNQISQ